VAMRTERQSASDSEDELVDLNYARRYYQGFGWWGGVEDSTWASCFPCLMTTLENSLTF
jgi:hypothetical protein